MLRSLLPPCLLLLPVAVAAQDPLPLRVLYAGEPTTAHAEAFARFLAARTRGVTVVANSKVSAEALAAHDVLVVDGHVLDKNEAGAIKINHSGFPLSLDDLQGKPTVLIGGTGGQISDRFQLKLGWNYG